jgi:hypothetical protein
VNQYLTYEWLKSEYTQYGIIYDLQQVKYKFKKTGLSDQEIVDAYADFNYYALPKLRHLYE